jgi:hypothetical protein
MVLGYDPVPNRKATGLSTGLSAGITTTTARKRPHHPANSDARLGIYLVLRAAFLAALFVAGFFAASFLVAVFFLGAMCFSSLLRSTEASPADTSNKLTLRDSLRK